MPVELHPAVLSKASAPRKGDCRAVACVRPADDPFRLVIFPKRPKEALRRVNKMPPTFRFGRVVNHPNAGPECRVKHQAKRAVSPILNTFRQIVRALQHGRLQLRWMGEESFRLVPCDPHLNTVTQTMDGSNETPVVLRRMSTVTSVVVCATMNGAGEATPGSSLELTMTA